MFVSEYFLIFIRYIFLLNWKLSGHIGHEWHHSGNWAVPQSWWDAIKRERERGMRTAERRMKCNSEAIGVRNTLLRARRVNLWRENCWRQILPAIETKLVPMESVSLPSVTSLWLFIWTSLSLTHTNSVTHSQTQLHSAIGSSNYKDSSSCITILCNNCFLARCSYVQSLKFC